MLVAQAADRAVHPASVSKVPTTLALLRKLGADHRFPTRFSGAARCATACCRAISSSRARAIPSSSTRTRCSCCWRCAGSACNASRGRRGARLPPLQLGSAGRRAAARAGARRCARRRRPGPPCARPRPRAATRRPRSRRSPSATRELARCQRADAARHAPLAAARPLVKALNGYSNNIFANFADAAGGIEAVQAIARESVPAALRDEIVLGDGAGANPRNRLSPRAAVALLRALNGELAKSHHSLADVLPVAGIDEGTLRHRLDGPGERGHVVGKTGTYGDYGASRAGRSAAHARSRHRVLRGPEPRRPDRRRAQAAGRVRARAARVARHRSVALPARRGTGVHARGDRRRARREVTVRRRAPQSRLRSERAAVMACWRRCSNERDTECRSARRAAG